MGTYTVLFIIVGCASTQPKPSVDQSSVDPGGVVSRGERRFQLLRTPISVGRPLPSVKLVDAMTIKEVDLSQERGNVLFLNIVPSLDTHVCDAQTHYLGEAGDRLPQRVQRITISRDTPFVQKRFAQKAKLTDIRTIRTIRKGNLADLRDSSWMAISSWRAP